MQGKTLNRRYRLERILGAGGFGQTYLATDIQHPQQRLCVVKQLKPASQEQTFLSVARRLFETEVKSLKKLGDHAQIPTLYDSFEEDEEFYLVQEYIDGPSLEDEFKINGPFDETQAVDLLRRVLPILQFIHKNHVVHRDLKPDNLIRREETGEVVLIDFGAVKEIRTKVLTGDRTGLTIGIGTQGYTPSEQLSGKPRYSSDLYALGMTVIHAITGKMPTDLPENFGSLDPQWQNYADISPGLSLLLGKMTRHYIHQRYQHAEEVLRDLDRLDELPAEAAAADTYIETALPNTYWSGDTPTAILRWRMSKRAKRLTVALSTLLTSAFVLGLRQIGAFVPVELTAWDSWTTIQPQQPPDSRLAIVEISESDLRELGAPTPSDKQLAEVIEQLQAHQPTVIGLDLMRDLPQGEGADALAESLQSSNLVAVTTLSDPNRNNFIPPPAEMGFEQLSFNNIIQDSDFRVRRALMLDFLDESFLNSSQGQQLMQAAEQNGLISPEERPIFSLGIELALRYLEEKHNIAPAASETLQLGDASFEHISSSFGGYQGIDAAGYQMMVRYRTDYSPAPVISFADAMAGDFDPALIENRIVLIGTTAASGRDFFQTPFNTGGNLQQMPGVMLHAQVTSQVLSAVLDGQRQIWAWPDWAEVAWIIFMTAAGGGLMVLTQRGPVLIGFGIGGLTVAGLVSVICFSQGGWVPVAAPMSAFFLSAAGARISKSYQRRYWESKQTQVDSKNITTAITEPD